ncbi:MAG: hypothetical protein WCW56_00970 [Candidatus Paceibacterota bacterium]|jgi:hypothetical protein
MDIFQKVKELNLPIGSYVVFGGGPMSARGIKEAHDIDILTTPEIYEKFKKEGWEEKTASSGSNFLIKDDYELFRDWNFSFANYNPDPQKVIAEADIIDGVAFASLDEVRRWKSAFAREKDLVDIKLIDDFLAKQL